MKRSAGEMGLAPKECICDPMDLAAMGHMLNCPCHLADAAKHSFEEDHHVGVGRSSIKRSHRAEGRNWVD
jgi:hypothetical protein